MKRIENIKGLYELLEKAVEQKDDERAHSLEDSIRETVLVYIAEGAYNSKELAQLALSTNKFNFNRWCA